MMTAIKKGEKHEHHDISIHKEPSYEEIWGWTIFSFGFLVAIFVATSWIATISFR